MRKQSDQLTIPGCGEVVRVSLNSREIATILAALRLFQRTPSEHSEAENEIATDGGKFDALTNAEIDRLCERLNS